MIGLRLLWSRLLVFQGPVTDNFVFRLHYKLTFPLLLVLRPFVAVRQIFWANIKCLSGGDLSIWDEHCLSQSTFSVQEAWKPKDRLTPYPGVDKYRSDETRVYHSYYQWVSLALFVQAVLFIVPVSFWRSVESGRIRDMVSKIKPSSDTSKPDVQGLASQVISDFNHNGEYVGLYFVAEVMNAVNVVFQIGLMDAFLGGLFLSYGSQAIASPTGTWKDLYDYTLRVFPRIAKCDFNVYGSSGDVQRHDAICVLPLNIFYEKIYLFLWFWFIALAILSCLAVVYRVVVCMNSKVRRFILTKLTRSDVKHSLKNVLEARNVGDWFVIYLLNKNLRPTEFKDLVKVLDENSDCGTKFEG